MSLDDFLAWFIMYCVSGSLFSELYIWILWLDWYSAEFNSNKVIALDFVE